MYQCWQLEFINSLKKMATPNICHSGEIQEIILAIKKTVNQNFRMDSSTIEIIQTHLDRLKGYLETYLDNSEDLLSIVSDFIESTNNLLDISSNHLQKKQTLK